MYVCFYVKQGSIGALVLLLADTCNGAPDRSDGQRCHNGSQLRHCLRIRARGLVCVKKRQVRSNLFDCNKNLLYYYLIGFILESHVIGLFYGRMDYFTATWYGLWLHGIFYGQVLQ
jgi:hypothetical protein